MRCLAKKIPCAEPTEGPTMAEQAYRLGDLIDDYCPRCRLLLNHAVASMMGEQVVKVICKTCHTEHAYRRGQGGKQIKPSRRATLFEQVLASAAPTAAPKETDPADGKKKRSASPARYITRHKSKPKR